MTSWIKYQEGDTVSDGLYWIWPKDTMRHLPVNFYKGAWHNIGVGCPITKIRWCYIHPIVEPGFPGVHTDEQSTTAESTPAISKETP